MDNKFNWLEDRIYSKEIGLTRQEVANQLGVHPSHLYRFVFNGQVFKPEQIIIICRLLKFNEQAFIKFMQNQPATKQEYEALKSIPIDVIELSRIPRIGYVEAGQWNEACQLPEDEWEEVNYVLSDSLKGKKIFALGVKGNSMNKIFPPGRTTLICCPIEDYEPRKIQNNDHIIAYREKDGLCEATVKKYFKGNDETVILIAESDDPRYSNIILNPDDAEYRIGAIVIDFITKLKDL